jgi:hypothetical protein
MVNRVDHYGDTALMHAVCNKCAPTPHWNLCHAQQRGRAFITGLSIRCYSVRLGSMLTMATAPGALAQCATLARVLRIESVGAARDW